jgi:outer membrane receptor protein involved in Fe transport
LDASFREDTQDASGYYNVATVPAGSSASTVPTYSAANAVPIDYRLSRGEYSFGANYLITPDVAVFARYSQGTVFNADRIMDNGPLSGSTPIPINRVKQLEGGVKLRHDGFSAFVTAFDAKTDEYNYFQTFESLEQSKYEGKGVELESGYHIGGFHINLGATYTDATVTASSDAALVGQPENRQPKFIYQVGPGYSTELFDLGLNLQGLSSATETDNVAPNNKLPAYRIVTGHFDYYLTPKLIASLGVYNLFNTLAYTELDGTTSARALNGRNSKLSVKYSF